jgi:hypothetical protein
MDGVAPELVRMALPVLRADFTILETYRIQGVLQFEEGMTADDCCSKTANSLHKIACPMTVIGGGQDSLVDIPSLHRWRFFSASPDSPQCDIVLKPSKVRSHPLYCTYVESGGAHFYFMDKTGGGEEWFFCILSGICKEPLFLGPKASEESTAIDASSTPPQANADVVIAPAVTIRV